MTRDASLLFGQASSCRSHRGPRVPGVAREEAHCTRALETSACFTFANVPLAKAAAGANPGARGEDIGLMMVATSKPSRKG